MAGLQQVWPFGYLAAAERFAAYRLVADRAWLIVTHHCAAAGPWRGQLVERLGGDRRG